MADNAEASATIAATQTANQFKAIRGYYTENVISKVKANGALKPSFDHKDDPNAVPLPATLIHDMSEKLKQEDTSISLYSAYPFPNRNDRVLDEFQSEAWAALVAEPDRIFVKRETIDEKETVRVAISDRMVSEGCVSCHNTIANTPKDDWRLGDVRGVLEVATVIDDQLATGQSIAITIMLAVLFCGAGLVALTYFGTRRIATPLSSMTQAMEQLANGNNNVEVPAQDRTDEIGLMSKAVDIFKSIAIDKQRLENEQEEIRLVAEKQRRETMHQLADDFES